MRKNNQLDCRRAIWRNREAFYLNNDLIQLVSLTGGGHIAELRFTDASGLPSVNPLWIPPWKTIDPFQYRPSIHARLYGSLEAGRLLSGIVGHNICLDHFGPPSEEEAANGLSAHGEAPNLKWRRSNSHLTSRRVRLKFSVRLPEAGLAFTRELELCKGESVVYITETVTNKRKADHFFDWTQHVTTAPPFLGTKSGRVFMSATKGLTSPAGYEGKELLKSAREFRWPYAPAMAGGTANLTRCFIKEGLGFVATVLLDPRREVEYVAALDTKHHLLLGYCFRRSDYPWVTIWEENHARTNVPWSGRSQARGLEFGSAPFPVSPREAFTRGPLFGTPTLSTVSGGGRVTIQYAAFLAHLPEGFKEVREINLRKNEILIYGSARNQRICLPASGLGRMGLV
ncbi:MAG TPA: hypothetical protein VKV95_16130 [Terriglobia bacterium]|nr:hypothetical protein [Terriglobia bacterium]